MRATVAEALERIRSADGKRFANIFSHGTLQVEFYAPEGSDHQTPHARDEVYVVISGSGKFMHDGTRRPFGPGDFLFVPAGIEHRFEEFTEDLAVWVIFYGPEGGEAGRPSS